MTEPIASYKMEANFEGLIQLLARNLYSEPLVFVRELLQNSHDSIVRRREIDHDLDGRIDIMVGGGSITFSDNGIGMDQDDITDFLTQIGSTGTGSAREELEQQGRDAAFQLIGQFGIGMLSAFVVADRIVVRTRKLGYAESFAWHNDGSADCTLFADERPNVGTDVEVIVNKQNSFVLDAKRMRDAVLRYCDFLPFDIYVNNDGPVNQKTPPWQRTHWASEEDMQAVYQAFLLRRYHDYPLDIIPISIDGDCKARGVLYISDRHVPDMNTAGVVDIFVRRMLVVEADNTLLPRWAKFIRGAIDSPSLQPTAARDNIQRDSSTAFSFLQAKLGEIIIDRLSWLANNDQKKFRQINNWHHYHLKGMAWYHDDFFNQIVDLLLFETNRGRLSLRDYITKNAPRPAMGGRVPLFYFSYYGAAAQFYRLADARGWVVINAGRQFEEELLKKYATANSQTVYLERLDASDDSELYQRLTPDQESEFRQLELDMEGHLHRLGLSNVAVRMRTFVPTSLPAVIILTPESEAVAKLRDVLTQPWFMPDMEDIAKQALLDEARRPLYLSLNADSLIIRKLADAIKHGRDGLQDVMLGIYHSAVLHSHSLLTRENVGALHDHGVRLLNQMLDGYEQQAALTTALEQGRAEIISYRQQKAELDARRTDHVVIFMITPFDASYAAVEQAVRRIFEWSPYWFEVRLARDYTHRAGLLANVREHMTRAHGFVAEVSELNPNVMFELGAAMMPDDGRPVFALRVSSAKSSIPADFKENLFITYGEIADQTSEIERSIRRSLEKDGRIVHDGVLSLLKHRKKRFLSRTALENCPVKLSENQYSPLLGEYSTVDDFIQAAAVDVQTRTGIEEYLVQAIQGVLRAGSK